MREEQEATATKSMMHEQDRDQIERGRHRMASELLAKGGEPQKRISDESILVSYLVILLEWSIS
jgi:hypothetical protein